MIRNLFLFGLIALLGACAPEVPPSTFTINGTVRGDTKGYQTVFIYSNPLSLHDSTQIVDGKFVFEYPYAHPARYLFYTQYDLKVHRGYAPFGLLIDQPGKVELTLEIDQGFKSAEVSGAPTHALWEDFLEKQAEQEARIKTELAANYDSAFLARPRDDHPDYAAYQKDYNQLQQAYLGPVVEQAVQAQPGSFSSAFLLSRYGNYLELESLETLFEAVQTQFGQDTIYEMQRIADLIQGRKNAAIGATVANFSLKNEQGKLVSFDDFRTKHVLIDFWASWCVPCIKEFPHLQEVYARTDRAQLEILAISTDRSAERWLKAVEKYNNPWPQLLDTARINDRQFGVQYLPSVFLVGPEGEIIAKNLSPAEVDELTREFEK